MGSKKQIIEILNSGGVAIMPTDTIMGILGSALNKATVEKIYEIKGRTPAKPLIILISDFKQLLLFNVEINDFQKKFLESYWPGAISVILKCSDQKFEYLSRGTKTLAFRLPNDKFLQSIIKQVGPLVAPSANPEGLEPAKNIKEAKKYFGKEIDVYQEGKIKQLKPSTLVDLSNNKLEVLRGSL